MHKSYCRSPDLDSLRGARILFFSYGSGAAAAMFSATVRSDTSSSGRFFFFYFCVELSFWRLVSFKPSNSLPAIGNTVVFTVCFVNKWRKMWPCWRVQWSAQHGTFRFSRLYEVFVLVSAQFESIKRSADNAASRLDNRTLVPPEKYAAVLLKRDELIKGGRCELIFWVNYTLTTIS